ncbi:MAG TPA: MBL fold metallo-hydrolase [Ktedonobacterales bacterium]|jgi:glyoxylase-like metal-dependent hydrolase (beta-lactamase superfamily II)
MPAQLPTSRHFRQEPLLDGVYAAIGVPGTGSGSNAGIIDLGDRTLVFDTFLTPQAGDDLRAAAERLTGRPVSSVINSHMHADHIHGNQAFALDTPIIATSRTRELIAGQGQDVIDQMKREIPAELAAQEAELAREQDDEKRAALALKIGENRELVACGARLALRLPEQTFDTKVVFHGARRSAELLTYGGGHTDSDAFLLLREEKLAFLGDLLFVQAHLWMGDGNPDEWLRILRQLGALDLKTVTPGHGPVGTPEDFAPAARYIEAIQQIVGDALKNGKSVQEARATPIPAAFAGWTFAEGFGYNIESLLGRTTRGA